MSEVVDSLKEMHDLSIALGASTPNSGADGMDHILRCPLSKRQLQVKWKCNLCFLCPPSDLVIMASVFCPAL